MCQTVKNLPATQETWVNPWVGKIPWRREQLPVPAFWSGEFHGQRSLAGYGPWGHKESDVINSRVSCSKLKAGLFGERHSPVDFPVVKNLPANAGATGDGGSIIESGRSSRGGNGNPLQYSWTDKPGQRSLADYSLRDHKELDTTEHAHTHTHTHTHTQTLHRQNGVHLRR